MPRPPVAFLSEQLGELEHRELIPPSDIYVTDFQAIVDRWFGSPRWRSKGTRLTLLATSASGGMYCLWWYTQLGELRPPVVYLGSEGNGLSVVANGAIELIEIVTSGKHWVPDDDDSGVFEDGEVDPAKLARFAERAIAEYGLVVRPPTLILKEGRANHPDFASWCKRQTR